MTAETTRTIKIYEKTHPKLRLLAAMTSETMMELIDRLVTNATNQLDQQETKTMIHNTITISTGTYTLTQLARLVANASKRGEWYDGAGSTNIEDWLAEGEIDNSATIESLAAEWDE